MPALLTRQAQLDALEARLDAARRRCSTGYGCGSACISLRKECQADSGASTSKQRLQRLEQLVRGEISQKGIGAMKPAAAEAKISQIKEGRQQRAQELRAARSTKQQEARDRAAAVAQKAREALQIKTPAAADESEGPRPAPPSGGSASNPRQAYEAAEVELGRGMFGSVRMTQDGLVVKRGVISQAETRALKLLADSPVTPKLLGVELLEGPTAFGKGKNGYMVLQPAQGEVLTGWIGARERTAQENREVFSGMLKARKALHLAGIAHNDMHAGNLFWDSGSKRMMVIDFGMARIDPTAALIEGLGTARGLIRFNKVEAPGDYQSRSTIQALNRKSVQNGNPDWKVFKANRRRVESILKAEGAGELITRSIRSVPKANLLTKQRAAELVQMLYAGL